MVPIDDQRQLQPSLLPGERPLWTGRPPRGLRLRWADLYLIPFSLLWGGFAIFWNVMVWTTGAPFFFALFGLPFLIAGLYLIAGRFLHDAWLRSSLLYAVTDRRVIVLRSRFGRGLSSADLGYLPALEFDEHPGGRGTLRFNTEPPPPFFARSAGWSLWAPSIGKSLIFDRIERPRLVYDLIRRETERRRFELTGMPSTSRAFIG
ncbi:MAG: hypothetical protein ABWX67_17195 [Allosphingosinicella sp.]